MRVQYPKLRNMAHTTSLSTFSLLPKDQAFKFCMKGIAVAYINCKKFYIWLLKKAKITKINTHKFFERIPKRCMLTSFLSASIFILMFSSYI